MFLWWQVSRHDPPRRPAAHIYMATLGVSQIGWVALAFAGLPIRTTFVVLVAAARCVELAGPVLAERTAPTPWHPHHIAERYGLLVIITLGEGIIGTVASLNAVVHGGHGWTVDAALVAVAGVGLTFGSWWMYFALPWGDMLHRHRRRAFAFGYGHLVMFASLAAMGGGLHVAALFLERQTSIGETATVLSVAIPVAVYILALYVLYSLVMRTADPFHLDAARRNGRRARRGGAAGGRRRRHGRLPGRADAGAGRDRRRLRARRPPAHRGGDRAHRPVRRGARQASPGERYRIGTFFMPTIQ